MNGSSASVPWRHHSGSFTVRRRGPSRRAWRARARAPRPRRALAQRPRRASPQEIFELADYPFDLQGLTITMVFNCRVSGPLPIEITVDPSCAVAMSCYHLCPPSKEFTLQQHLSRFENGADPP